MTSAFNTSHLTTLLGITKPRARVYDVPESGQAVEAVNGMCSWCKCTDKPVTFNTRDKQNYCGKDCSCAARTARHIPCPCVVCGVVVIRSPHRAKVLMTCGERPCTTKLHQANRLSVSARTSEQQALVDRSAAHKEWVATQLAAQPKESTRK